MNGYCALREYRSDPYIAGIHILHSYIAHHPVGKLPISAKLKSHLRCFLSCSRLSTGVLLCRFSQISITFSCKTTYDILGQPAVACSKLTIETLKQSVKYV